MTKISPALSTYEPFYERILPTGSRVICNPPPKDTDEDYLVLVTPENLVNLEEKLVQDGWVIGGSMPSGGDLLTEHRFVGGVMDHSQVFHSWKRYETPGEAGSNDFGVTWVTQGSGPEINLLVTCNKTYFDDFTRATFLCQGLNLTDKADRVTVFEALTRDVWPTGGKKKKKDWQDRYLDSIFYGDENTVNNFTGFAPAMEVLPELVAMQADMAVNPPIVVTDEQFVNITQPVIWWNNATPINPPAPGQTVTLMNGQVVTAG